MSRSARHRSTTSAATSPTSPRRRNGRSARGLARLGLASLAVVAFAAVSIPFIASQSASASDYVRGKEIARDLMNQRVGSGWGKAAIGGTYTYVGKSHQRKDGTSGVMSLPRVGVALSATLNSVSASDVDLLSQVYVRTMPTKGSGVFLGTQVRKANKSYYQTQVRIAPSGNVELSVLRINGSTDSQAVIGTTIIGKKIVKVGTNLTIETQVTGTSPVHVKARAWISYTARSAWQIDTTDSSASRLTSAGAVGTWAYASRTSHAQAVHFNNLDAFGLTPAPSKDEPLPSDSPTADPTTTPTPTPSSTPTTTPTTSPTPTPTATPTQTPTDPTPPTQPLPAGDGSGAAAIGSTSYAIPSGALFVSPSGSDSADGSQSSPFRTVAKAIDASGSRGTIVIRAGVYHESVTIPASKSLTIQSYPKEAVWFDGSSSVSDFKQSGSNYVLSGWTTDFDDSPTFTRGAPDNTQASWAFVNPAYPMAAHPDQVWIDGAKQAQVGSVASLAAGKFFVDTAANKLYLGSNPAGHAVRAADLVKAITISGQGSKLLGIGVRNYSPSVPDLGAVGVRAPNVLVENVAVLDSATVGLSVSAPKGTVNNTTVDGAGLLGFHANYADGLVVNNLRATSNNAEHFNTSPVSGGAKITRTRGVTVSGGSFSGNLGNGVWFDESVYNGSVTNSNVSGNQNNGIVMELSAKVVLAGNTVLKNVGSGIKIDSTSGVDIWNNTVTDNARNINLTQSARRASNQSDAGHDPRQAFPDPTMTWIDGPMRVYNNVIGATNGSCQLCVEDYSHEFSAAQMGTAVDSNVFQSTSAWAVVWSKGAGNPSIFNTVAQFAAATGWQSHSLVVTDSPADATGLLSNAVSSLTSIATPLPANIASLVGQSTGSKHLGAW